MAAPFDPGQLESRERGKALPTALPACYAVQVVLTLEPRVNGVGHRKGWSRAVLGAWIVALLVGIVDACGWDDVFAASPDVDVHHSVGYEGPDGPVSDCVKHCAEAIPVVPKNLAVLASGGSPTHFVAARYLVVPSPDGAPALRRRSGAPPPRAAPPLLRFLRLTL